MKIFRSTHLLSLVCFLVFVVACRELSPETKSPVTAKEELLGELTIKEAQQYYNDILLQTPKPQGNRTTAEVTGHPIEKDGNFDASFTYQYPNVSGNIVVVPLTYKLMQHALYYAGDDAKGGKPEKSDFRKNEVNHLNNLIIYRGADGKVESCVQRIISYDTKKKKGPEGVKWKNFNGLVEYFDWNENFLFGFVINKGKVSSVITSITDQPTPPAKNGRTNVCSGIEQCFNYYACSRNSVTGAFENCSDVTSTCKITNVICVDTSDPNNGYSIPPGMGGTYVDPNNPAVAAIWDRGQVVNQIMNNPMSLLKTTDCPENVAAWANLAQFIPPQSVRDRVELYNAQFNDPTWGIQYLDDAEGLVVNCDYFSVKVSTLPAGYTNNPAGFLNYIRKNINSFTDQSACTFIPHPNITGEQAKWELNPEGALIYLDVFGFDNGTVVCSQSNSTSWTFSTIAEPYAGFHPVSGNRTFGYVQNPDGSYTYYCKGVDRVQARVDEVVGKIMTAWQDAPLHFVEADGLWGSFTNKIKDYVNSHNGVSAVQPAVTKRPNYYDVKDVLDGVKALSEINCP